MSPLSRYHQHVPVLFMGAAYASIGVLTAAFARAADSAVFVTGWRLLAWVLCLIAFVTHLGYERMRSGSTTATAAFRAAAGVAFGALLLALAGPVRSYWGTPRFWQVAASSVVLWPIITGAPAFVGAYIAGVIHDRAFTHKPGKGLTPQP